MNTLHKLLKNTFYVLMAQIMRLLLSIFLIIYISRILGVAGIGKYATIVTFIFFFEQLAKLGFSYLIVRGIAVDKLKSNEYFTTSIVIGVASSLAVLPVLFLVLEMMHYPVEITSAIKVLSLSIIFFVLTVFWISIFEGQQRMEMRSIIMITRGILRVSLGILAIYLGYGILGVIWSIVIVRCFICFLTLFLVLWSGIRPTLRINWAFCFSLLKQTWTFLLISIIATTYWKIDVVMLSKIKGISDVGVYNAAYRLMEILKVMSFSYIAAFFPMISNFYSTSKASFKQNCVMSVRYLFILTFPIAIGTSILAKEIILFIYGNHFVDSVIVLKLLIWTICLFPVAQIFARTLVASNKQKYDLWCNIVTMILNVVLNYILIPRYSYIGASVATLASICLFFVIQYFFICRTLFNIELFNELSRPFLAGCLMGICTYFLRNTGLFFAIGASACLYTSFLFIIRTFSAKEVRMFQELWRNKFVLR